MNGDNLRPCPFCGAEAFIWRTNHRTYIECKNYNSINHLVRITSQNDERAIERWNMRESDEKERKERGNNNGYSN